MTSLGETGSGLGKGQRRTVAIGLLIAVATGVAAGGFESVSVQSPLFALSSTGWVIATAILVFHHGQRFELTVAAGFLILTVAETLLWVNGHPGDPGYEAGFAGGAMFYVPGVLLAAAPGVYPPWIRAFGVLAGGVLAVGAARFLTGSGFAHTDPLAMAGYGLISAFFLGVAWVTLRGSPTSPPEPARVSGSPATTVC